MRYPESRVKNMTKSQWNAEDAKLLKEQRAAKTTKEAAALAEERTALASKWMRLNG